MINALFQQEFEMANAADDTNYMFQFAKVCVYQCWHMTKGSEGIEAMHMPSWDCTS